MEDRHGKRGARFEIPEGPQGLSLIHIYNNTDRAYNGAGFYGRITAQGYQSCCVGKMHNLWDVYGPMGFESRHSQEEIAAEGDEYMRDIREKYPWVFDYHGMRSEMYYTPQISQLPPEDHPTQWVGDRSVDFIQHLSLIHILPAGQCGPQF